MKTEIKRQLVHGAGCLNVIGLITLGPEGMVALILLTLIGVTVLSSIRGRSKSWLWILVEKFISSHERPNEGPFMGLITFYTGMMLAIVLFPLEIAMLCIIILSIGDALSTLVGKLYGKHKLPINRIKSWEGSITFFISALAILLLASLALEPAIMIAAFITLVEGLPKLNDNITIPLAVGFALLLL